MSVRHAVIVTAAGASSRFNGPENTAEKNTFKKEFLSIGSESVLCRSIKPFLKIEGLVAIVITYRSGDLSQVRELVSSLDTSSVNVIYVEGGATRQESVFNGLKVLKDYEKQLNISYVSIHDGARPFVETSLIKACIKTAEIYGGACPCIRVTDTLVRVDNEGVLSGRLDRTGVCTVQTPQTFKFPDIYEAHLTAVEGKAYTDDSEIFMDWGGRVGSVKGDPANRKITYAEDLKENRQ